MILDPPIDFDKAPQSDTLEKTGPAVTVTNIGTADLEVKSLKISGSMFGKDKNYFELRKQAMPFAVTPFTLPPGGSKKFDVVLLPRKVGKWSVTVTADSNSDKKPKQSVAVVADVRGWVIVQVVDKDDKPVPNLTVRLQQKGEPEQKGVTSAGDKPESTGLVRFNDLTSKDCKLLDVTGETLYEFMSLKPQS